MSTSWTLVAERLVDASAALLSPPHCASCDAPVALGAVFCPACATAVERTAWSATGAAFVYGGPIARAIARLKYENRPDLARPLGHLLASALDSHAARWQQPARRAQGGPRSARPVVVPVPLHPSRLATRGFNQSGLIAAYVARRLDACFWPLALARARDTPQQMGLDRAARLANVRGAFHARNPQALRGRCVILIDDVRTTGATLEACGWALVAAGAARIVPAAVARAEG